LKLCEQNETRLITIFIVDVNTARYFAGTGVVAGSSLRDKMEEGLLDEHQKQAREVLDRVEQMAGERGIECRTFMKTGRFAEEVRLVACEVGVDVIIVTRAQRPEWMRRLFGSPIDRLCCETKGVCDIDIV